MERLPNIWFIIKAPAQKHTNSKKSSASSRYRFGPIKLKKKAALRLLAINAIIACSFPNLNAIMKIGMRYAKIK